MKTYISHACAAAAAGIAFAGCDAAIFTGYDAANAAKIATLADKKACDFSEYKEYTKDKIMLGTGEQVPVLKVDDPIYNGNSLGLKAFVCQEHDKSAEFFRAASKARQDQSVLGDAGKAIAGALVNDNMLDYSGTYYELPTAHAYLALDILAKGKLQEAYQAARENEKLQADVLNNFQADMKKQQDEMMGKAEGAGSIFSKIVEKMVTDNKEGFGLEPNEKTGNLTDALMRSKKNFLNTFADYTAAVTYYINGATDEASFVMKNIGETLNSKYFANEAKFMETTNRPAQVWVVYENGLGTPLEEYTFSFPVPSITTFKEGLPSTDSLKDMGKFLASFNMIEFAVSKLGHATPAYESIAVNGADTQVVSNMDSIIRNEYKSTLNMRLFKAVLNAAISQAAQEVATGENKLLGLGVSALAHAKNKADVRYFVGLPKDYQAVRVANNGHLTIKSSTLIGKGEKEITLFDGELNDKQNYLVHVKSVPNPAFSQEEAIKAAEEGKEYDVEKFVTTVQIIGPDGALDAKGQPKYAKAKK